MPTTPGASGKMAQRYPEACVTTKKQNFVAPYIGMIASTVIAVKVRSWSGAPTVCNLLPTDSSAGIGVLRTGLKIILWVNLFIYRTVHTARNDKFCHFKEPDLCELALTHVECPDGCRGGQYQRKKLFTCLTSCNYRMLGMHHCSERMHCISNA